MPAMSATSMLSPSLPTSLVMPLTLGAVTVTLLTIAFVIVCVLMMMVILIQKPKGGGLSGAFGGAGGGGATQAAFGAKTGDVLTWVTVVFFVMFLLLAMGLTWTVSPPEEATAPAAPAPQQPATAPGPAGADPGQAEQVPPGPDPASPPPAPGSIPGQAPADALPTGEPEGGTDTEETP